MNEEIIKQLSLTYYEQVDYLKSKYGMAQYDYFSTEECKSQNKKISRTLEGLFCHHVGELDGPGNLSNPYMARGFSFELQKKENLVYCDYLEHLILHLKMHLRSNTPFMTLMNLASFLSVSGMFMIANDMNTLYKDNGCSLGWKMNCYKKIQDYRDDYFHIIKGILCYAESEFIGKRENDFEIGDRVYWGPRSSFLSYFPYEIEHIDEKKTDVIIRIEDGSSRKTVTYSELKEKSSYDSVLESYRIAISELYDQVTIWTELYDYLKSPYDEQDQLVATIFFDNKDRFQRIEEKGLEIKRIMHKKR